MSKLELPKFFSKNWKKQWWCHFLWSRSWSRTLPVSILVSEKFRDRDLGLRWVGLATALVAILNIMPLLTFQWRQKKMKRIKSKSFIILAETCKEFAGTHLRVIATVGNTVPFKEMSQQCRAVWQICIRFDRSEFWTSNLLLQRRIVTARPTGR